MDIMTAGLFGPIEDVIREAEQRAEAEWKLDHELCPHVDSVDVVAVGGGIVRRFCSMCGALIASAQEPSG